jgi:hypothetical protein
VSADVAAGYQFPFAYLEINNNDNLIVNPLLFVEIGSHNFVEFVTPYFVPRIKLDIIGAKWQGADL